MAWTLLGCISDMGGLMGDELPGVLGPRIGDEKTCLAVLGPLEAMGEVCWAMCARTASLCSETEDRVGVSAACLGACSASDAGQRARDGDADATTVGSLFVLHGAVEDPSLPL